ncbi:hypothetical protein C8R43DRAFT_441586 [Mycena crocata]|nr:hypothetical protein C8R43DRAFT_441586 [Mycena crocata]
MAIRSFCNDDQNNLRPLLRLLLIYTELSSYSLHRPFLRLLLSLHHTVAPLHASYSALHDHVLMGCLVCFLLQLPIAICHVRPRIWFQTSTARAPAQSQARDKFDTHVHDHVGVSRSQLCSDGLTPHLINSNPDRTHLSIPTDPSGQRSTRTSSALGVLVFRFGRFDSICNEASEGRDPIREAFQH